MDSVAAALHTIRVQNWTSIGAFLSILIVPLALGALWLRYTRRRPNWQRVALGLSGCLGALLYAAVAFVFAVCWGGEIGESGKARLARAYGTPVVEALDRYHAAMHAYPEHLTELVPAYLGTEALRAPERAPLNYPFEYSRDSVGYELVVRYTGPGMNECRYRPGARWHCSGYF